MKRQIIFALIVVTINFCFLSCSCMDCNDIDPPKDTTENIPVYIPGNTDGGNIIANVIFYSSSGQPAIGAAVKIARTYDSVLAQKYFGLLYTDSGGVATFKNLPASTESSKSYFLNATYKHEGKDMSSIYAGGNGPIEAKLKKGTTRMPTLIITTK